MSSDFFLDHKGVAELSELSIARGFGAIWSLYGALEHLLLFFGNMEPNLANIVDLADPSERLEDMMKIVNRR